MPTLRTDDGATLQYECTGAGDGVLLIQGVGVVGNGWRPQLDRLARDHLAATWDHRGIGGSSLGAAPLSIGRLADDALALLDALGLARAHVVGHSMGGVIAQELALRARDRVRSLALLCTFDRGKHAVALTPTMMRLGLRTRVGTRRMRRLAFLQMVLAPDELAQVDRDALAAELAPLFGHDLGDQPPIVMPQLRALAAHDASPRLAELAGIPTLVLSARHDVIARPRYGQALAAAIPGARYVEANDAGHGVPLRQPDWLDGVLREHFGGA